MEKYHIGCARYQGGTAEEVLDLLNRLQAASKIPLLIAANCDSGGNGAFKDGTYIASGAQTEASGSTEVARNAGYVSGREMASVGINVNFDPCVDILYNWRNTIVNTRAYGTTAEDFIKYTSPFIAGQRESDIITCIKHWSGDGPEERDQHLVLGVNDLSVEEWDNSFGKVFSHHINDGVEMIMSGRICLPEYQRKLVPGLEDKDILPAAIAAGCDLFLFFNVLEEDFGFMKAGVEKGVITKERLDDANRRVLGLKAKLNLHKKQAEGTLLKDRAGLDVVGCEEHLAMRADAADKGITLVKNTLDQLPLTPKDHRRIRLYSLTGEVGGIYEGGDRTVNLITDMLTERGTR